MARTKRPVTNTADTLLNVFTPMVDGLSPMEACVVSRALSSEKVKGAIEALVPEGTVGDVDVVVRVRGHLERGQAGDRKPTSRALCKGTLALLVRRMGLQREAALALLGEVLTEACQLDESAERKLLEEHPEVADAFARVDSMVEGLPRIAVSGRITVSSATVERVSHHVKGADNARALSAPPVAVDVR